MIFPMTPRQYLKQEEVDIFDVIVDSGTYKAKIVTALKSRYNDRMMGRINPLTFTEALKDRYNFLFPRYETAFSMYAKYENELDEVEGHIRTLISATTGTRATAGASAGATDRTGSVEETSESNEKTDGTSSVVGHSEVAGESSKTDLGHNIESGDTETLNQDMPDVPLGASQYLSGKSKVEHGKNVAHNNESNETSSAQTDETNDTIVDNNIDATASLNRATTEGSTSSGTTSEDVTYNDDVESREINMYKSRAEMLKDAISNITSPYELFAFEFNDLFVSRW